MKHHLPTFQILSIFLLSYGYCVLLFYQQNMLTPFSIWILTPSRKNLTSEPRKISSSRRETIQIIDARVPKSKIKDLDLVLSDLEVILQIMRLGGNFMVLMAGLKPLSEVTITFPKSNRFVFYKIYKILD